MNVLLRQQRKTSCNKRATEKYFILKLKAGACVVMPKGLYWWSQSMGLLSHKKKVWVCYCTYECSDQFNTDKPSKNRVIYLNINWSWLESCANNLCNLSVWGVKLGASRSPLVTPCKTCYPLNEIRVMCMWTWSYDGMTSQGTCHKSCLYGWTILLKYDDS